MADNFLDFLGSIGSTPAPVYGTSAEDAALRPQIAAGLNTYSVGPGTPVNFLKYENTPSFSNFPGNPQNNLSSGGLGYFERPTPAGNGMVNPTAAFSQQMPRPQMKQTMQASTYNRPVSDLLAQVGTYGGAQDRLTTGPTTAYSPQAAPNMAANAIEQAMIQAGITPPIPASVDDRLNARAKAGVYPGWANPGAIDIGTVRGGNPPVGANPGMGGAMIGDGRMASSIPPQGAPPPGIAPTVFAGDPAPAQAKGITGTSTSGYTYQNGQRTGVADWAKGLTPAQQYAVANGIGRQKALQRQAALTGVDSMGRVLQNGKVTGSMKPAGMSTAQYQAQQTQDSRQKAIANSKLSADSKDRASRSASKGDAHGMDSNGNPGWW